MSHRKATKQSGFTVIEMLVACAVSGALLILIMSFITNTLINNTIDTTKADLLREAQLSLDSIGRQVRLSASVDEVNRWEDDNSPNAGATNGYGWTSDDSVVILASSATDSSDDVIFSDATHYITHKNNTIYFVENGVLYRRIIAGETIPDNSSTTTCPTALATEECPADTKLAENVSEFSIRYLDSLNAEVDPPLARSIELTLKLETEKYGRDVEANYITRMVFRNE